MLRILALQLLVCFTLLSCTSEFLEIKPRKGLVVPETLSDFQMILDNFNVMNTSPGLVQIAADDFTISDAGWNSLQEIEKNTYTWELDLYGSLNQIADWNSPYQQVFYSNVVLDGIKEIKNTDQREVDKLKGAALFYRACAFFHLSQQFAVPYQTEQASKNHGIPIPETATLSEFSGRGSLQSTYEKIIQDLSNSFALLPPSVNQNSRPSKAAAAALLAEVYLHLRDYERAIEYATKSLDISNFLLDFNTLDTNLPIALPIGALTGNREILFYSTLVNYSFFNNALTEIDSSLIAEYSMGDLRRNVYFEKLPSGKIRFRGSLSGTATSGNNSALFSGLTVGEVYLIRAEAYARINNTSAAIEDLNKLLAKRFDPLYYKPIKQTSSNILLEIILRERRKETVGRGKRWRELRRLNSEANFSKIISRKLNGVYTELIPNSVRYTFPIPKNEIELNSLEQNPR